MSNNMGKCYYCKQDVIHEKLHDYGAFTKRYDKKKGMLVIKDVWHMECYVRRMNEMLYGSRPKEECEQLSFMELLMQGSN